MRDEVCVVTGANSVLGRVVSTRLAGLGARVYLPREPVHPKAKGRTEPERGSRGAANQRQQSAGDRTFVSKPITQPPRFWRMMLSAEPA